MALRCRRRWRRRGGDQSLDLGGLGVRLSVRVLGALDFTANDVFPDIVFLGEVEESANLGGSLGTEALGQNDVGQSGDLLLTLLDDNEGENGDLGADDAATDGLALALTASARAEAGVAIGKEQTDTVGDENTLLHGETLLVVTTGNSENVTLPFIAQRVARNFLRDPLVVEDTESLFVIDVEEFLGPGCGVGNVELHS